MGPALRSAGTSRPGSAGRPVGRRQFGLDVDPSGNVFLLNNDPEDILYSNLSVSVQAPLSDTAFDALAAAPPGGV